MGRYFAAVLTALAVFGHHAQAARIINEREKEIRRLRWVYMGNPDIGCFVEVAGTGVLRRRHDAKYYLLKKYGRCYSAQ
jgi:hypothetical protein